MPNRVHEENQLNGSPGWELRIPADNREIEGFCDKTSYNVGDTVNLYVSARNGTTWTYVVYRVGWYGGIGARAVLQRIRPIVSERRQTPPSTAWPGIVGSRAPVFDCLRTGTNITVPASQAGPFIPWTISSFFTIPESWVSGVYLVKLISSLGRESYIIFTLREDERECDVLVQTSSSSWQSYNSWPLPDTNQNPEFQSDLIGAWNWGMGQYDWMQGGRMWRVSYNRPYGLPNGYSIPGTGGGVKVGPPRQYWYQRLNPSTQQLEWVQSIGVVPPGTGPRPPGWKWGQGNAGKGMGAGEFITNHGPHFPSWYAHYPCGWEVNMVRYLERFADNWDIKYFDNVDFDRSMEYLYKAKVFLSMGHDEYWSRNMVWKIHKARADGISCLFSGANDAYWECRFDPDTNDNPGRIQVCYKNEANQDAWYAANGHPTPAGNECVFRHVAVAESDWRYFEGNFQGMAYLGDPVNGVPHTIQALDHWVVTGANVNGGEHTGLVAGANTIPNSIGYEYDASPLGQSWLPANLEILSTVSGSWAASDRRFPGAASGTWTNICIYRYQPSNAYVFSTGSMNFNWALDDFGSHWGSDMRPKAESEKAQKLIKNVLRRMIHNPEVVRRPFSGNPTGFESS